MGKCRASTRVEAGAGQDRDVCADRDGRVTVDVAMVTASCFFCINELAGVARSLRSLR